MNISLRIFGKEGLVTAGIWRHPPDMFKNHIRPILKFIFLKKGGDSAINVLWEIEGEHKNLCDKFDT